MAKTTPEGPQEDVKKLAATSKIIIGTEKTLKLLRTGKLSKVFLAKNTNAALKQDIMKYAQLKGIAVVELPVRNDELGALCKKPFSISVLGQAK